MSLDPAHQLIVERVHLSRHAKGAILQVAAGATGDLAEFARIEIAELITVEFAILGEGDMIDIEVETHADRICRHQIFDIAGLIECHLRIAGARAERPQHDGRATALTADEFRDRIDLVGGKGDDGGALRQTRDLLLSGIEKMREPRPLEHGNPRQKLLEDGPHRGSAEQQRFVAPTQVQNAVGENMPALQITGKLHLVDRDKGGARVARHRLDGADRKTCIRRRYLFLAGNERDMLHPDLFDDARIDLARKQPQRQADYATAVGHHALDGIMGLAGIGRSEHRGHAASAQDHGLRSLSHRSVHGRETAVFRSACSSWRKRTDDDHM